MPLLNGCTKINKEKLDKSLNWGIRSIINTQYYQDVTKIKSQYKILKPSKCIVYQSILKYSSLLNGSAPSQLVKTFENFGLKKNERTGFTCIITGEQICSNYMEKSFLKTVTQIWNNLPDIIKSQNQLPNYKKRLKNFLLQNE